MSATDRKMIFRIPADMKAWLKSRADMNERTMTGELLMILKAAAKADPAPPKPADKAA